MKRITLKFIMIISIVMMSFILYTSEPGKEPIKQYTITFEKNDSGATGTMSAQTIASGSSANLTTNGFSKTGWTFAGWSTTSAGSGTYINSAYYTMGTSSVTLYAKWTFILDAAGVEKRELVLITGSSYNQKAIRGEETLDNFDHNITTNFLLGKYEITYELWYTVYQWAISNGYTFANAGMEGSVTGGGVYPDFTNIGKAPTTAKYEPVTMVNWYDIIVWCNAYSEMSGFTPCYSYSSSTIKDSRDLNETACDEAICNWSANGYRLPSEGEWQYAASNKGATPYNYASGATANYNDATECQAVAWYCINPLKSRLFL